MKNLKKSLNDGITANHTGKMTGIQSYSTSCLCNENCEKYRNIKGSICEKCYAGAMCKRYSSLNEKLIKNTELITTVKLSENDIPDIYSDYFRFESFGDLSNELQFENYCTICRKNSDINFAIWTKNPHIIHNVFAGDLSKKPANLKIVVSSIFTNKVGTFDKFMYFIDHIFTVYTAEYLNEHKDITINCGGRSCRKCLKCYKHSENESLYINELLKSDTKKAIKYGLSIND